MITKPVDMRGKKSSNAIPGEVCIKIFDHISSHDVKTSLFRKNNKVFGQLNVKILFDTFCNKHPGIKVLYVFFRRYFKENFNLRFGRPKIDVSSKCEEISCKIKSPVLNENAKKVAVAELMVHRRRAQKKLPRNESIKRKYR